MTIKATSHPAPVHAVHGGGRAALMQMLIRPEQDIASERPDCTLCTWAGVPEGCQPNGPGLYRLKFVSASCPVHQHVRCLPG